MKRMKRQFIDLEKRVANHISNKGTVPRIHEEFSKLNSEKAI